MPKTTAAKAETLELSAPQKLTDEHDLSGFDCGEASINDYLLKRALKAQLQKHSIAYVVCLAGTSKVVGFYTLSNGSIARNLVAPRRHQRNSPEMHPVTVLGRMGVSAVAQGRGYAVDLLQDALERCLAASEVVGSTAVLVHPLNQRLANFYAKHAGFVPCPTISPLTMMLSLR